MQDFIMIELTTATILPNQNSAAERVIRSSIATLIGTGGQSVDVSSISLGAPVATPDEATNTKVEVTTLNDPTIKESYRDTTFTFKYNRASLEESIYAAVPLLTNGVRVSTKEEDRLEAVKAQVIIGGINTDNLVFENVAETTHLSVEAPIFSNIDKGILIKNTGSHLYYDNLYVYYTFVPPLEENEDPTVKAMLEQAKEIERLRNAEIDKQSEDDKTRRQETLAAIKAADAEKLQGYTPSEHLVNPDEIINPSNWDIADDFILPDPIPEPEPVPPPPVPEPDEIPIPPPPPPTPKVEPQPEPHFNLGKFANVNEVAKNHMVATDTNETADVRVDVKKSNPDNPLLYTGAPKMRQALSVADVVETPVYVNPKQ